MQTYHIRIDASGRELGRHGTPDFPLAAYTTRICKNILGFIDWHWHEELQFCCVTKGEVLFRVEEKTLRLAEGQGIFIAPGLLHQAKNAPGTDSSYICLDYHPRLMQHAGESLFDRRYLTPFLDGRRVGFCVLSPAVPWQQEILQRIVSVRDGRDAAEPDYFALYLDILHIWQLLYQNFLALLPAVPYSAGQKAVHQMAAYIRAHYAEPLRLAEVAAAANLAESTCCRAFKKAMGITVFEYLGNVRLLQSERLLLETDLSITEIALQCGFGTASYYNRRFKAQTGLSPRAYRQKHLNKA